MNRNEWTFEYSGKVLHTAVMKKFRMHSSRLKFWKEQRQKWMTEVRARGLTVEETLAAAYSSANNNFNPKAGYDQRAVITVDTRLQTKLNECASKIGFHAGKSGEYDAWVQVLRAHPKQNFELHQDDYLFFFGK